ncbi:MAG: serine carboxypeptidase [Ardenticatenaceae bacterium]|nr:serine carboxypeptidase [Ardenticatenaceae bacterium]
MKRVLVIHLNQDNQTEVVHFLGQEIQIQCKGCGGDPEQARALIAEYDGRVDAIGLDGLPTLLELGPFSKPHELGQTLPAAAQTTPVVDGSGIRAGLERWGVILADRAQPGIFAQKHILMVPGLNHPGLTQALNRRSPHVRYADPVVYFALPQFPGVGSKQTLNRAAPGTLEQLQSAPFRRIKPQPGEPGTARAAAPFEWADVIAGDIGAIRRYAPAQLKRKTVVVECANEEDVADLRARGVSILVTLMPSTDGEKSLGRWSAAAIEAMLAALRPDPDAPLTEDTYLDLMAEIEWTPGIRYLQPAEAGINRFAFVIHPLNIKFIHNDPRFLWTRFLPDKLVETVAAYMPPIYISRITGGQSPTTGQKIEGYLFSLAATPREMMRHGERFTYGRLNQAARMAERKGARIMGLGAFTSVVGDAGITVAHESDIAITSGNSLTVSATLEAAKQAVIKMGRQDLTKGKVMIIGATGSIGSICSRLLAQAIFDVVLVSIEPERLIDLKRTIQEETPGAHVTIATRADGLLGDCDLIVTATSAFGQRIVDVSQCKPGAVVCDVARPPDINKAEADLRPDVLVIESGEVLIPGDIDFGYNIGLPPKTAYACLAETALLAMEGRFEDYTLGRNITIERVKEIYRLFKKHEFQIAGLRSFDEYVTDEFVAEKRKLADEYRADPEWFARVQQEATAKIAAMPVMAKGVTASDDHTTRNLALGAAGLALLAVLLRRRK